MPGTLLFVAPQTRFFLSHRVRIALAAKEAGWRVCVACPPSPESGALLRMGLEFAPLPVARSGLNPLRELVTAYHLWRIMRHRRPNVVHLITAKSALSGGLACLFRRTPTVVAVTGLGYVFTEPSARNRAIRRLVLAAYRVLLNRPDSHFLFQNPNDMAIFRTAGVLSRARATMIPGAGIDLKSITPKPLPAGTPIAVMPARMLKMKGVEDFREAALLLRRSAVDVTMRLVGDPDSSNPTSMTRADLQNWVDAGDVEWIPHQDDMDRVLGECHFVVLPSRGGEGLPKTLIDAAAAGRAAISTAIPGCQDAIVDGQTGLVCAPRNPAALAEQIGKLSSDPALCARMGANARRHAEQSFDIAQVIQTHLEIYRALTGGSLIG